MFTGYQLTPSAIRILAALVNFGVAAALVVYIRIAARDMRWSRSYKRFVTRNAQPGMFWLKLVLALLAIVFTSGLGVLLLIPPQSRDLLPVNVSFPALDPGHRR